MTRQNDLLSTISKLINRANLGYYEIVSDCFELIRVLEREKAVELERKLIYDEENFKLAHDFSKQLRLVCAKGVRENGSADLLDIYRKTLLFDAPYDFDAYCRYIEWDRPKKSKFYEPRRKQLRNVVQGLQDLEDNKIDLLCISLPPGVGKSTIALFYLCWISGRCPDLTSLVGSHNNEFLRGCYDECLRIMDSKGEYLWHDVFPSVNVSNTNAKGLRIDLDRTKRFETFQFSGVNSGNAGKVRATHLLYLDDLVEGIEQAMSKERMDMLWQKYTVDYRQRKQGNIVKELHIATRWSVNDPIGRLEIMYDGNPRARFINEPALDESDNSRFDYPYGLGFSTEMYHDLREGMDDVSWKALYMGQPIEREGQLYHPDELQRYLSLPLEEPDAILAVTDTKDQGGDYFSMPIFYQYGNRYYLVDTIYDNGKPNICEERAVQKMLKHKVKVNQVESNRAGGRVAENLNKMIKERNGVTRFLTKWNQTNKETRIIVESGWIKEHVIFPDTTLYDKEMRSAMNELTSHTMSGKNAHDDFTDAISQFSTFAQQMTHSVATISKRTF